MLKAASYIAFGLIAAICVALFPKVAETPVTFSQWVQDREATEEKYKDYWDDETITTLDRGPERSYELGDVVATLTLPALDIYEMPIYYGSDTINNNWQITPSGYLGHWDMFGDEGVACVGAHNYQLFHDLPEVPIGSKFIIETDVDVYVYEIIGSAVYDHTKDDFSELAYRSAQVYSTDLITCYPIEMIETEDSYILYSRLQRGTVWPGTMNDTDKPQGQYLNN